jgi:hypothetical protein
MRHPGWAFQTNRLRNSLEILAMPTKAIIYGVTKLMH